MADLEPRLARAINESHPGWLCDHHYCRDLCPECKHTVPAWLDGLGTEPTEEPMAHLSKLELAEHMRTWIASQGIRVSDLEVDGDGKQQPAFTIQLEDDEATDEASRYQVYRLPFSIPRNKDFTLASDWEDLQSDEEEEPEEGNDE